MLQLLEVQSKQFYYSGDRESTFSFRLLLNAFPTCQISVTVPYFLCLHTLKNSQIPVLFLSCRDTLSEVVRVLRGLPHRLLRLPAVLHRQIELGLHHLLQHAALQRPQEEASHQLSGDARPADEPASSLPDTAAPSVDVDDVATAALLYSFFFFFQSNQFF